MPNPHLPALLEAVDAAARAQDITALFLLMGTIDAARDCCLRAIAKRMGHAEPPRVTVAETVTSEPHGNGQPARVHDRWISARECASRLNISTRTLRRRCRTPPYARFCIPQGHGFKVSEVGLEDFMRRARR